MFLMCYTPFLLETTNNATVMSPGASEPKEGLSLLFRFMQIHGPKLHGRGQM